ncbi:MULTISPECIES: IclR family transcriptional regulator [unclassified Nocardioides]|uniref:IclR family transcriptional regulator n=1 Tax=unclassified Nocardioides TaxID=2615069 RepID=UPI0009EAA4F9|nr:MULTISPECIES: IclR family transcriptional regulator [unclassified Nocardioides]
MTSTDADGASSAPPSMVERMTLILEMFDDRAVRLRLDEVSSGTGLPRSTSHRILEQLVRLRWLRHSEGGYGLGQRAIQLGGDVGHHDQLRSVAVPLLQELHDKTGRVVQLGILDFSDVVYLDQFGAGSLPGLPSRVGGRAPAYAVALGKAQLAWVTPEEVDALFEGGLRPRTPATITDLFVMHQELRRIRGRHGLTFEKDEYVQGVSGVASAIRGPEGPVAAVALCGSSAKPLERYVPLVLDATRRISQRLFPDSSPEDRPSTVWSDGMMENILARLDDDAIM